MNVKRIIALSCIYLVACAGWSILGTVTKLRSDQLARRLGTAVETLWGTPLIQKAPSLSVEIPGSEQVRWIMPSKNDIQVDLKLDYRKKGLIWYPTYVCSFDGSYEFMNKEEVDQKVRLHFDFPAQEGTYDEFSIRLDGEKLVVPVNTKEGISEIIELAPGESSNFHVTYKTRGIREWRYRPDEKVGRVQDLSLILTTDFSNVDYTEGSLSPTSPEKTDNGMVLTWKAADLITKQDIGIVIPEKLNPGPVASRITFFAPVGLIFFFVLIVTINILCRINIHPMHYLFVAAGFFAFHLLLAYLVDHIGIHVAFAISAVVSVILVTSYLSGALGKEFPWKIASAGQIFFLVLFSYSFFLKRMTGLTVAVGSVVTLAVLMKVTAHIDWEEIFSKQKEKLPATQVL